jgi:hypothetical protein
MTVLGEPLNDGLDIVNVSGANNLSPITGGENNDLFKLRRCP